MSKFANLKMLAHRAVRPVALTARRRSPEILMGVGVAGLVTTGVLLVRQTLKVQPILEEHSEKLEDTKSQLITPSYSEQDMNKDVAKVYTHTAFRLVKHYGPTVTLGIGSVVALLASNGIMRRRNVAVVAAYKALQTSYDEYRKRVGEYLGEDKELDIYRGFREEEVTDEETGEVKRLIQIDKHGWSIYSKFFDEFSPYWNKTPEYNLMFLRQQEMYFNDLLIAKGYVFLNEVYKALGIPETQAGQHVGWTLTKDGDNYIDFNIYDFGSEAARAFVNGHERSIHLDFNVDGPILDVVPQT